MTFHFLLLIVGEGGNSRDGTWSAWNLHAVGKEAMNEVSRQRDRPRFADRGACFSASSHERFQAKWKPVRVKKTRQIKNLEPRFDSIEAEKALGLYR